MKYFRQLDKEKTIKLLEEYRSLHNEYPTTNDFSKIVSKYRGILPSVRWIQNHGGLINFYNSLGIHYTDARTGARRSSVATAANKKAQGLDVDFSQSLVKKYGERNIHWQSPYNDKGLTLHRSDFKVYTSSTNFFFIDLFFPKDIESLIGCANIKIKKISKIKVNAPIYFVSCNEEDISSHQIDTYILHRKKPMPKHITLMHISDARIKLL